MTSPRQLERQAEQMSDEQVGAANEAIPPAEAAAGEQPPVPEQVERTPAPIGAEPAMTNPVLEKEKEMHNVTTPPAAVPAGAPTAAAQCGACGTLPCRLAGCAGPHTLTHGLLPWPHARLGVISISGA